MRKATILVFGILVGAAATFAVSQPWQVSGSAEAAGQCRHLSPIEPVRRRVRAGAAPTMSNSPDDAALDGIGDQRHAGRSLDPHSSYTCRRSTIRDMQVQTRGEFGGLGIEVTMEDGLVKVRDARSTTPPAGQGGRAGGRPDHPPRRRTESQGLTLSEAVEKMRGPGSTRGIELTVRRAGS